MRAKRHSLILLHWASKKFQPMLLLQSNPKLEMLALFHFVFIGSLTLKILPKIPNALMGGDLSLLNLSICPGSSKEPGKARDWEINFYLSLLSLTFSYTSLMHPVA